MTNIKLFESQQIRTHFDEDSETWFFSVVDVIAVLSESNNPRRYYSDLKRKLKKEGFIQLYEKIVQFKLSAPDGKLRMTDCADAKTMLRIIQSVPSKKAEPFKQWLAQVGQERLEEIENPALAQQRAKELYKAKGYPEDWIEKRLRTKAVRDELTDEWNERGIKAGLEYSILTAEISRATFGLSPSEYKKLKGLKSQNLRDHMTDLELIFTMLGEASTTEIARRNDAKGFQENKQAAREGGSVAGNARRDLEQRSGKGVISPSNYLPKKKQKKNLDSKDE